MKTVQIWSDTIVQRPCRSPRCRKLIYFAQNVKTQAFIPFDERPVAIAVQPELGTTRQLWTVDLGKSHFATCVGAPGFRRRGGR